MGGSQHRMQAPFQSEPSFQPTMWPSSESWPLQHSSQPKKDFGGRSLNLALHQRASISVKERGLLRLYYEKIFQNLQQTNCRIIAKAYIKLVEPRKQVNYPYNGRKIVEGRTQQLDPEATKPPWWPRGVSHREPDHLPKFGKTALHYPSECPTKLTITRTHSTFGVHALRDARNPRDHNRQTKTM